jgi:Undecaprenyl-phosphate glucose phosphotransferase
VASAVHLADFVVAAVAGWASFVVQSAFAWPLPILSGAAHAFVLALGLALVARTPKPSSRAAEDLTRQGLCAQLRDGAAHALSAIGFALVVAVALLRPGRVERAGLIAWLLEWAVLTTAGVVTVRLILLPLLARWRRAGRLRQSVAIYGTGALAELLVERLRRACSETIEIIGVFDDRAGRERVGSGLGELPHGTTADLVDLSRQFDIDRIIVALPHSAERRLLEILRKLHKMPVDISLAPDMVGFSLPAKDHDDFDGLPLLDIFSNPLTFSQNLLKSMFDRIAAALGIVALSPVLLLLGIAIELESKGPALFRQNRFGFGDRVIQVYKFRTMYVEASDPNGERQSAINDPRITGVGGFLRRWSLDELPQLFNVLRGELSLVGPRPHAISMRVKQRRNEDIVPDYALRHHVKPGITGWAQVNSCHGPVESEKALHERIAHDLHYINQWSLWFDIRILLRTLVIVFRKRHTY